MSIPWQALFDFLLAAIDKCKEHDPEETIRERLLNPRGRVFLQIRRGLRQETELRGAALTQAANEAFDELKAMTPNEVDELIAEAREFAAEIAAEA